MVAYSKVKGGKGEIIFLLFSMAVYPPSALLHFQPPTHTPTKSDLHLYAHWEFKPQCAQAPQRLLPLTA